jgi:uncharacterized protein DUF998
MRMGCSAGAGKVIPADGAANSLVPGPGIDPQARAAQPQARRADRAGGLGPISASTLHRADDSRDGTMPRWRQGLTWALAVAGLVAYNWWLLVPLKPGLMTSPNELFSNLEVSGQPYATLMQHADLLSGVLLLAAVVAAGRGTIRRGGRDWLAMIVFTLGGAAGGLFPEVCADGINAICRQQEVHFQLPASHYIHMVAGIVEFAGITVALFLARRRNRTSRSRPARLYRRIWIGALVCYPLLGLAYLVNRMGGVMEAVFFLGFTVMAMTWIAERTSHQPAEASLPGPVRTAHRMA